MAKSIFTKEQNTFMINNYKNMKYEDIGKVLGFSGKQIKGRLNNLGYTKLRKINYDFFKDIDSPIKAYFLGFIFADGWICFNEEKMYYEFGMEFQSQDKYILERLNYELGNKNKIKHFESKNNIDICGKICNRNESDVLRVYSKTINFKFNVKWN